MLFLAGYFSENTERNQLCIRYRNKKVHEEWRNMEVRINILGVCIFVNYSAPLSVIAKGYCFWKGNETMGYCWLYYHDDPDNPFSWRERFRQRLHWRKTDENGEGNNQAYPSLEEKQQIFYILDKGSWKLF